MTRPPNFLWITFEDTSPRLGCYGDKIAKSPWVDELAKEGLLFQNAFCTAAVCAPSRCSIITGMYASGIGAQHMRSHQRHPHVPIPAHPYQPVPPPFVRMLPEYLRAAGYFCTNCEKTDYQFEAPPSSWHLCHRDAHWRQRALGQPFFAVFNLDATHESGMWDEKGAPKTHPASITLPPYLPDTASSRAALARQYDHIEENDSLVGQLLRELEEDGVAQDTVVMLWSDHGEGLPRAKRWPYDTGIRVPLIVRWPGRVRANTVTDQLVSLIDLPATVLELAQVPRPCHLQSVPFLDAQGQPTPSRSHIFATRDRYDEFYDCIRAARDGRFKYIRNYHPELPRALWNDYLHRHPIMRDLWQLRCENRLSREQACFFEIQRLPEELYDTQSDPYELRNLAGDPVHAATLQSLRDALDGWQAEIGDLYREPEEQMAERFWPGGIQPRATAPVIVGIDPENPGLDPILGESASLRHPCQIQLYCATQGGMMVYTLDSDPEAPPSRWTLYQGPFALAQGTHRLRCQTSRLGYGTSEIRECLIEVVDPSFCGVKPGPSRLAANQAGGRIASD
jgi:arylsulfatase A-like enzyme